MPVAETVQAGCEVEKLTAVTVPLYADVIRLEHAAQLQGTAKQEPFWGILAGAGIALDPPADRSELSPHQETQHLKGQAVK